MPLLQRAWFMTIGLSVNGCSKKPVWREKTRLTSRDWLPPLQRIAAIQAKINLIHVYVPGAFGCDGFTGLTPDSAQHNAWHGSLANFSSSGRRRERSSFSRLPSSTESTATTGPDDLKLQYHFLYMTVSNIIWRAEVVFFVFLEKKRKKCFVWYRACMANTYRLYSNFLKQKKAFTNEKTSTPTGLAWYTNRRAVSLLKIYAATWTITAIWLA